PIPREAAADPMLDVSFVPMACVSESTASVLKSELRTAGKCRKGYTAFQRNDILVAKITPCFENGKIAIADIPCEFGFGSTEFHVVRPIPERLDARFLLHFLRAPRVRVQGERRMTGSAGQRRVPADFLSTFDIPLPPLPSQRRIAEVLDRAEALRAKRRAALAQLDSLTQSLFLDLFGDPRKKAKYPQRVLAECAEVVSGIAKGRRLDGKKTVEVPYLRVANVQAGFLDLSEIKTIEALPSEIAELALKPGDVVLTEGGDHDKLGRGAMWDGQIKGCIHQNHVFRVRPEPFAALAAILPRVPPSACGSRLLPPLRQAHHESCQHQHDAASCAASSASASRPPTRIRPPRRRSGETEGGAPHVPRAARRPLSPPSSTARFAANFSLGKGSVALKLFD
ncbi:MAG: restriction endonuclease subunit S, partial [Opitutaceae bacterium]